MIKIRRALLSVTDKGGLVELAQELHNQGVEIVASQGTGSFLQGLGIPFLPLAEISGYDQAFGGRCKSLSLGVMGGLLFDRTVHQEQAKELGIAAIDMVVCNLYDFNSAWQGGATPEQLVEQIDIGGVALLRASAKNCRFVVSACDPCDYPALIKELQKNKARVSRQFAKRLAVKSFVACSQYDRLVALGFGGQSLRYGENPHQKAWSYSLPDFGFSGLTPLQGKELSYNNFLDIKAALDCLQGLSDFGCVIVKHGNPCGFCQSKTSPKGLLACAWAGDSVSAFGSIVGFAHPVDAPDLHFLALDQKSQAKFVEVVVAPGFTQEALEYLAHKKNLRACSYQPTTTRSSLAFRQLEQMLIAQEPDVAGSENLEVVCGQSQNLDAELVRFGNVAVQALSSNAVTIVYRDSQRRLTQVSMGCGQPNRLDAIELAIKKLKRSQAAGDFTGELADCYLVSDAFLPFADNVQALAASGIKTIVQPGGSIRDKSVLAACQKLGVRMVFTGTRHFRH